MHLLDLSVAQDYIGVLLQGLKLTIGIALAALVLSLIFAIPVALGRLSSSLFIRVPIDFFVELIRTTPLLLQLIYIYYVLPQVGIRLDPFTAGVVGLTMHYSAYIGEVYRAGINGVPWGQRDAAEALGLNRCLVFRHVILPQALRIVAPALGNYAISIFKDTALTSVMSVQELMFSGEIVAARTYQYFTMYTLTGLLYAAVGYPSALLVRYFERVMSRGYVQRR